MTQKTKIILIVLASVLAVAAVVVPIVVVNSNKECDHQFSEWSVAAPATCVDDGKQIRTCEKCGETEEQVIKALGHTPGEDDGDCTTAVTCTVCGAVTTPAKTEHIAHADDGDCTTPVTCTACDTVLVPAKSHDFSGEYEHDADGHWHICSNDGCHVTDDKTAHTPDREAATEEHAKTCTTCGYIMEAQLDHTHNYNVLKSDESGHWYECKCGEADPDGQKEAHSGTKADDCTKDYVCDHCGYVIEATHDHVAGKDDGNCTTPIGCINCGQNAVAGTDGHQDNNGDYICDNPGCQVAVGSPKDDDEGIDLPMDRN